MGRIQLPLRVLLLLRVRLCDRTWSKSRNKKGPTGSHLSAP